MQMEQAVLEIVSNALDAMPRWGNAPNRGDPRGGAQNRGSRSADTGAGIPEAALASVFDPFFTTRQEGTGLGLSIAKRYVEQNGGRLEIESRARRGTRVRIRLPADAGEHATPSVAGSGA